MAVCLDVFSFATASGAVSKDCQHYQHQQRDEYDYDCNLNYHEEETNKRDELSQQSDD
jgi:hypothetical protein